MIVRRCGDRALVVDLDDVEQVMAVHVGLEQLMSTGEAAFIEELVPAAATVLILTTSPMVSPAMVEALLPRAVSLGTGVTGTPSRDIAIPVDYSRGWDVDAVAEFMGMTAVEVIDWHVSTTWVAAFGGFAPGFMYLTSDTGIAVPRRSTPRTAVPAGAVALADTFSAVYPRQSPGGWQVIGVTDVSMWDEARPRPSLIMPGDTVRFEAVKAYA